MRGACQSFGFFTLVMFLKYSRADFLHILQAFYLHRDVGYTSESTQMYFFSVSLQESI